MHGQQHKAPTTKHNNTIICKMEGNCCSKENCRRRRIHGNMYFCRGLVSWSVGFVRLIAVVLACSGGAVSSVFIWLNWMSELSQLHGIFRDWIHRKCFRYFKFCGFLFYCILIDYLRIVSLCFIWNCVKRIICRAKIWLKKFSFLKYWE